MNNDVKKIKQIGKPFFYKILIIFSVLIAIFPFLWIKGIPFGNDASFHLSRVASLAEGLKNGVLFPGVYADYFEGMGYGNGLFYPDLFLYIPAVLMVMGVSNIGAYKIFLILLTFLVPLSMYYSVKHVWKSDFGAAISALLYLFCSFFRTDLYLRSSIGEVLAFVFLPLIVAGLWQIIIGDYNKWRLLTLSFSGLILSHVLSAVMMVFISIFFVACFFPRLSENNFKRMGVLFKAGFWCLVMTAFFLIPMAEQLLLNPVWGDTGLLGNIEHWAVPFRALIIASPQNLGVPYVPPPGIGAVLFCLGIAGIVFSKKDGWLLMLCISGTVLLFCASTFFPWELLGKWLGTLQFPWRLYLFISVFWCFSGGEILRRIFIESAQFKAFSALLCVGILVISFVVNVAYIYKKYPPMIENPYPYFAAGCEYLPKDTNLSYIQILQKQSTTIAKRSDYNKYSIELERNGLNELPIIYYKGYNGTLNGKTINLSKSENGMLLVANNETGLLEIKYQGTVLRMFSFLISGIGIILFLYLSVSHLLRKETC